MRYKTAKGILLEIGEDEQASSGTRLEALEMLAGAEKLPELKGYRSGSRENLLLRLASDSRQTAKDRLTALRQLLQEETQRTKVRLLANPH